MVTVNRSIMKKRTKGSGEDVELLEELLVGIDEDAVQCGRSPGDSVRVEKLGTSCEFQLIHFDVVGEI